MENEQEQLEALQEIRKMMKESSRFLSLSGLSGVFAGIYALAGAYAGHLAVSEFIRAYVNGSEKSDYAYMELLTKISIICGSVLFLSLITAFFLSTQKAKRSRQRLFDHTSKKVFWCMAVPLFAGGMFCLAIIINGAAIMVSAIMLLFYGLALLNSSKYTMPEIKYLGYLEIALGLTAGFLPGHGLLFWALGFGVLHIIYGFIMWFKYDR